MDDVLTNLSDNARVWIYQANKKLSPAAQKSMLEKAMHFVNNWSTHGTSLKAGAELLYDTFLVLSIDESDVIASGCSIDKSLHFIQQLEEEFDVNFLDRTTVAIWDNHEASVMDLDAFRRQINEGKIHKDSLIFNNLVRSKGEMSTEWKIPVNRSWLKKYLPAN